MREKKGARRRARSENHERYARERACTEDDVDQGALRKTPVDVDGEPSEAEGERDVKQHVGRVEYGRFISGE